MSELSNENNSRSRPVLGVVSDRATEPGPSEATDKPATEPDNPSEASAAELAEKRSREEAMDADIAKRYEEREREAAREAFAERYGYRASDELIVASAQRDEADNDPQQAEHWTFPEPRDLQENGRF